MVPTARTSVGPVRSNVVPTAHTSVAGQEESLPEAGKALEGFGGKHIWVFPMHDQPYAVDIPEGKGGHGGGDRVMLEQIFSPNPPEDPYERAATHIDGAASILLGIAANHSLETNMHQAMSLR